MKKIEEAPDWANGKVLKESLKLLNSEEGKAIVHHINDRFLYWDKVKYQKHEGIESEVLWSAVKLSRIAQSKQVTFGRYTFKYCLTDAIQMGLHQFDLNIGGNLGAKGIIPNEEKKRYLVSSIMEEAIASSQIEGAVTTRKKAKEMLRKNIKPRNKSEQMIVNNYKTIKHILQIQHEPITLERLFEIHQCISHQTLDDNADEGRYRDNNDVSVIDVNDDEIVHIPPGHEEVPALMVQLFEFFNHTGKDFIHPIVKGCIIHFMIGYIHPFVDGNGRTARALFYWYLLKNGYWLTEYLSISRLIVRSKAQYAQAFIYSETDENDLTYFIHYKAKTMQLAFSSLREYIQRKINEKKLFVDFHLIEGVNERQAMILKWIYEDPDILFNVKEIEHRFSISNQTARNDLMELVRLGYLQAAEMNKKKKSFYRSPRFGELLQAAIPNRK